MDVFDYIEKELDRIEVGYTSYDGTRLTMSINDVRELIENLRIKLAQNLPSACTDPIEREDVINILHDVMQGRSESEENLIGEIVSKVDLLPPAQSEPCGDMISREYLKEHIKACWTNGRPRYTPELNELLSWIDDVPFAQPNLQPTCNQLASDTISRHAAIKALSRMMDIYGFRGGWAVSRANVACMLRSLPSAQPETCEGCKHMGKWENEVEYGYPSPCTRCKRRMEDHYER